MPRFTLKFIAIDDALNLTETEFYLKSTLEIHLQNDLMKFKDLAALWELVELALQTPSLDRTFLGNESGIPVSLLRTDWSGSMLMTLKNDTIDNELLSEADRTDQARWTESVYMALQGESLFELLRTWGNHPVLQNVIAKVQVENADGTILDEANIADAFPPPPPPPKKRLFTKQSIIMTVIIMAVMAVIMLLCWLCKKRRAKKLEEKQRLARREKWNKLKERRDRERAEKKAKELAQQQPGTEEWMDEMTKSLTSIPVRDTSHLLKQSSMGKLNRQSSLHRSGDFLQGSMDSLYAIPESEESSSQFTTPMTSPMSSPRKRPVLRFDEEDFSVDEGDEDEDDSISANAMYM
jgi:hypothetical protein